VTTSIASRRSPPPAGAGNYEAPALCDEIAENYYASFFEDPDGNRLEVVCR